LPAFSLLFTVHTMVMATGGTHEKESPRRRHKLRKSIQLQNTVNGTRNAKEINTVKLAFVEQMVPVAVTSNAKATNTVQLAFVERRMVPVTVTRNAHAINTVQLAFVERMVPVTPILTVRTLPTTKAIR
jgi:hypothetical protein